LNGLAGTGKSTIARTVARRYYVQERLAASFFFSRGGGDVSCAGKFVTSIAVQLAKKSLPLLRYICEAITQHSNIATSLSAINGNSSSLGPFRNYMATLVNPHTSLSLMPLMSVTTIITFGRFSNSWLKLDH